MKILLLPTWLGIFNENAKNIKIIYFLKICTFQFLSNKVDDCFAVVKILFFGQYF